MIIAVDIGSQTLTIASLDDTGIITQQMEFLTPNLASDCLGLIQATIAKDFADQKPSAIVIGVPGVVHHNVVEWCSNLGDDWIGFDFRPELEQVFHVPVLVENDANLGGLAEVTNISPTPKSLIYLNIGAGIGSGCVIDGKLPHALLDSEAGMMMLEYDGAVQTWENFASGKAIAEAYNQLAKNIKNPAIWDAIADRISRGLLMLIPILQPRYIVIGGSMGSSFDQYQQALNDLIDERLPANLRRPQILAAKDPKLSVIYGCYQYFKHHDQ